jgi:hypothetical protein
MNIHAGEPGYLATPARVVINGLVDLQVRQYKGFNHFILDV